MTTLPMLNSAPRSADRPPQLLRAHMPELDVVRGIAILMVILYHGLYSSFPAYHGGLLTQLAFRASHLGWTGVNLFFVLSGFLISGILLDSKPWPARTYYGTFYKRRALRILPLYYAFLLVAGVVLLADDFVSPGYLVFAAAYVANFAPSFGFDGHHAITVIWSLAIEEQFYLLWPSVVRRSSARALLVTCLGLIVVSPFLRAACFALTKGAENGFSLTFTRLDGFAWGGLLAVLLRAPWFLRSRLRRYAACVTGAALGSMAALAPLGVLTRDTMLGAALQGALFEMAYSGILAALLLAGTTRWARLIDLPVLRYFGRISYCLYLFHQLGFYVYDKHLAPSGMLTDGAVWMRLGLVLVSCCLFASASYRFFESPLLRFKPNPGKPVSSPPPQPA